MTIISFLIGNLSITLNNLLLMLFGYAQHKNITPPDSPNSPHLLRGFGVSLHNLHLTLIAIGGSVDKSSDLVGMALGERQNR